MRIKVSLAQINPKSGDLSGNTGIIRSAFEKARREGADLVATPELCLTGYCLDEKLLANRSFLKQNKRILLDELLPATQGIAAVVGFIDFDTARRGPDGCWIRYNAAAVMQDGKLLQIVHKRLLPSYRYFEDKRYFEAGRQADPVSIRVEGGEMTVGVLICEDIWDEGYEFKPSRLLCEKGARLLVVINASPFVASTPGRQDGKRFRRRDLVRRQRECTGHPIVYVNTVGAGDNGKNLIMFDGSSRAYDSQGRLALAMPSFQKAQASVTFKDGLAEPVEPPKFEREQEIFEALVLGVGDYCRKLGFERVIEPISGGIDSALGAVIACQAMGPENVKLYNLPTRFNSRATRDAAAELARNLGAEYKVLPIEEMYETVCRQFEEHAHPIQRSVTRENAQSRLRGLVMMMESNDSGALLLSNGNATEIALGYATLYGDMAGGLAVLGDLTKPDVYRVSHYVNRRFGREVIPNSILQAVPSAELAEGQSDPFEYDVVGPVVEDCVERTYSPGELVELFQKRELDPNQYPEDVYDRYDAESFERLCRHLFGLLNRSVFKRLQGAPIIAVSDRAFGFDLRETLINGWEG
ncbi:MAG TPA: NAD(+) synthase [Acidobacteriota bacterium]|nr:NAD(+) synthase [Acidobacteriota bacterium]